VRPAARLLALLLLAAPLPAAGQVPLPADLSLTAPADDVPGSLAAYAGAWAGDAWNGVLPAMLVVERARADAAVRAVYAWGRSETRQLEAGMARVDGRIVGGVLKFATPDGVSFNFLRGPDGQLHGRRDTPEGGRAYIRLAPVGSEKAAILAAAKAPPAQLWEEVRIPLTAKVGPAAGQLLGLQATLYRRPGTGRAPVVILSHGATGGRSTPESAAVTYRWEELARLFLAQGYAVLAPMRKGRGTSEGPMLEPSDLSISSELQLESGIEDLDAAVEYVRGQKDFERKRVVLFGRARGGFLSIAYAGRFAGKIKAAINASGGWWSESYPAFDATALADAGRGATKPTLWLYAAGDPAYPLDYARKNFAAFEAAGGVGRFLAFTEFAGASRDLIAWPAKWEHDLVEFLRAADPPE